MKTIGYIGLGKMGSEQTARLQKRGYDVHAVDPSEDARSEAENSGVTVYEKIGNMAAAIEAPRTIWIMVPHSAVDAVLDELLPQLTEGDLVIDGGNSNYQETLRRAERLTSAGIRFADVGVSGGPGGAREGACLMVGASVEVFNEIEELLKDLAVPEGYEHVGPVGAGHFAKMVHNGIEYGMMQAIAEGFAVLRESDFDIDLTRAARIYNHGSVIESRLVGWLRDGYEQFGEDLDHISGEVAHSGEGQWTVEAAEELNVNVPVIRDAFQFRKDSSGNPSYTGKVVSLLRHMFGGHPVFINEDQHEKQ